MSKNKVKYGICNVHYAKLTLDENNVASWDTPVALPGAVSISLDANGETEYFYADNIAYYTINNNQGYDGDLEIALIPDAFREDILGETADSNGVLIENKDAQASNFALLFEFDGDVHKIRQVMYNCSVSRPTIESETTEESKEPKTDKLTIKSRPLPSGIVKAKTGDEVSEEIYNAWYDKVYEPVDVPSTSTDETTDNAVG